MARTINQAGLDLIKHFEGFRAKPYKCPAGVLTIGYGHTSRAGKPHITKDMVITKEKGEEILKKDLELFQQATEEMLGDANKYINENQYSALVSFCYNTGPTALKNSTLLEKIHARDLDGAADQFARWVYGGGKRLPGLVRRRKWEKALFIKAVDYPY